MKLKHLKLLTSATALLAAGLTCAGGTAYELRVDGLACPYCAYGIEKKLSRVEGVEKIEIDLNKGVVRVMTREGTALSEADMRRLIAQTGFTLRGMRVHSQ